jgi:hypothetical protein
MFGGNSSIRTKEELGMVIVQANRGQVTAAKILTIRHIIDDNPLISDDVALEIRRIGSTPSDDEKQKLKAIDDDQTISSADKEKEKTKKRRELAALSSFKANRVFRRKVESSV